MRVLIVEDDRSIAEAIKVYLEGEGLEADTVYDGLQGLEYVLSGVYDVILLDIMLPRLNGMDIAKNARNEGIETPIIMLTAKSQLDDKIQGFDCGADDYMTKPFAMRELLARIKARTRGGILGADKKREAYDIRLDMATYKVYCGEKSVKLSNKEYQMMEYLIINKGQVLTREMLFNKVWGFDDTANLGSLDVYIHFLRKKLEFLQSKAVIVTSKGVGYSLEEKQ